MNWFRKLLSIVRDYDANKARVEERLKTLDNLLRERTDVHADLGFRDNFVIVVGQYKDRDYIRVYSLPDSTFENVADMLREQQRHARLRVVDAPPSFSACMKRDLWQ